MSDSDLEEQTNELLVIKEICGEECIQLFTSKQEAIEDIEAEFNPTFFQLFQYPDSRFGGRLDISPSLNEDLKLSWSSKQADNVTVQHLPPITIEFCQPLDYPSKSSPAFKLNCLWLTSCQLQLLEQEFRKIASDNEQLVILYLWISVIKDDLFTLLEINGDTLNVQPLIHPILKKPKKLVQLSFNAKIDWSQRYQGQIKKFNHERGFGFINSHDLKAEIFFHITEFLGNPGEIITDTPVSFDLKKDGKIKKVSAVKVQLSSHDKPDDQEDAKELPEIVKMLKMHNEDQEIKIFQKSIFDCNVCFGEKTGKQCMKFTPCNHVFCNDCMKSYFEVQIKEGQMSNLICPMDKCTYQALPTQVQSLVSAKSFQLYEQVLLSTTLESMADVVLCPRRACQCPTIIDREASMGQCPSCTFVFCIYCKASFHGVAPCRIRSHEQQTLLKEYMNSDQKKKDLLEKRYGKRRLEIMSDNLMSETYLTENTKPCPKCQAPIQKSEGCNKMTCNKCNTFFCYLCGAKLPAQNPYGHFSEKGDCYQQLFEGVDNLDEEFFFVDSDDESDDEFPIFNL